MTPVLADLSIVPIHLPDWRKARQDRNATLGATTNWIDGVAIKSWRSSNGVRPKWVDLTVSFNSHGAVMHHTIRFWRHGAISLTDCNGGGINAQDTMRLFGVGHGCVGCMKVVNAWRDGRGAHRSLEYLGGDYHMTRMFMGELARMNPVDVRKARDERDHGIAERVHNIGAPNAPLPMRLETLAGVTMRRLWNHDDTLRGWRGRVYLGKYMRAEATCHKRGWGSADKAVQVTVTTRWLVEALAGKMFLAGCDRAIAGIVTREANGSIVAWAFKEQSPKGNSTWWKARFKPYRMSTGTIGWEFDGWLRNGAMPNGTVK